MDTIRTHFAVSLISEKCTATSPKPGPKLFKVAATAENELSSSITFNRNKNIGIKLKKMGVKILKKTIKDLDNVINNEFKKA